MSASVEIEVRAATPADRAPVGRLLGARYAEAGIAVDSDGIARAVELALAVRATAWLVVALRGGVHVGVALANPAVSAARGGASLFVEELYVPPPHRRRGVARALLETLRSEARQNGMRALEMSIAPSEEAAADLLRALGFHAIERRFFTIPS